ncbi:MAG: HlyD family efflux transporter periplasmic adaptor subunit [Pseudomonadota bacterium]
MSFLRGLLIVPPIVIGVALLYYATSNRAQPERVPPAEVGTAVRIVELKPRVFVPRVRGFGTVEPSSTWEAIAQVSARVTFVDPAFVRGGVVQKGQVLIRLAPEDYELAIAQSEANIQNYDAQLEEMQLSEQTKRLSLEIEQKSLELEQQELRRQERLVARGTVAQSRMDEQQTAVLTQRSKVQDLENQLALFPAQQKALRQSRAVAEAELETARLNLDRTVIEAPFDGRIASVSVEISQYVAAGTSMGSLDGVEAAEIDAQIAPSRMGGLARLVFEGQEGPYTPAQIETGLSVLDAQVSVGLAASDPVWEADVRRISDTIDPETRSIGVIVVVEDPYGKLRPGRRPPLIKGMFTQVELRGPEMEGAFLMPRHAVVEDRIKIVGDDDRLAFAPVEIAFVYRDVAVLASPPPAGTRVVVSDLSPAIEGMLLRPMVDEAVETRLDQAARPIERTEAWTTDR